MTERTSAVHPETGTPTRRLPCLVVMRGREQGRIISLERGDLTLGREERAEIQVQDRGVSRRHACFHFAGKHVWLQDLGSTNGVWCNGRRVKRAVLRDGDCLQFGCCMVAFRMNHPDEGRLLHMLYQRATRDPLTGLLNRASLEDRLSREIERQERYRRGLAVLQVDLDRFKDVNDTFGHAAGDAVLQKVARLLQASLRRCDLAARVGGEEFVLVLPEAGVDQAKSIAEKIRQRITDLRVSYQGKSIGITACLGVATAGAEPVRGPQLLAAADAACYRAKRDGRNQVGCGGAQRIGVSPGASPDESAGCRR